MSLMGSKSKSRPSAAAVTQRARDAATQVAPMAKNAVPLAKNAGQSARQSAEDAMAWAAPHVHDARAWAAPRVEQAGLAVRDKIAPAISEKIAPTISSALVEAAHRLDDTAAKRRRWPRVVAGIAMLAAACSAVAAAIIRRRPSNMEFGMTGTGATDESATPASPSDQADDEINANGRTSTS